MFSRKKNTGGVEGLKLSPSVSVIEGEQGTVLFDARRGEYYQVNELGLLIVRALGEGLGSEAIVERVVDAYDVSLDVAAGSIHGIVGTSGAGKSTLVGRLLFDSKSVLRDQLAAVEQVSLDRGLTSADLLNIATVPAARGGRRAARHPGGAALGATPPGHP